MNDGRSKSTTTRRRNRFRVMPVAALVLVAAAFAAWRAAADITTRWNYDTPGNYEFSDPVDIEVADGVLKLKLQADRKHDASIPSYYTNGTSRSAVSIGSDACLLRSVPYGNPAVFSSRILDNGGGANLWDRLQAKVQTKTGLNSGGEIPTNTTGLAALFHFNNDGWLDAVSGLSGVPGTGAKYSTDARLGSHAADFYAATQDYVKHPTRSLLNGEKEMTIACWLKLRAKRVQGIVIAKGTMASGFATHYVSGQEDRPSFYVNNSFLVSTEAVTLNEWFFLTGTWRSSDGQARIYFDGRLVATGTMQAGNNIIQSDYFYVSGHSGGYRMNGTIDEVAIFNRCLSATEVAELYRMPKSVLFQVRSSDSPDTLDGKSFVGPDGTVNTYYTGAYDKLESLGPFKIWERYAQYRAYLFGPAYPSGDDPYLDAVGLIGNLQSFFDDTIADFSAGDFVESVATYPDAQETPYLGLGKKPTGGYAKSATYTSRIVDGETPRVWYRLAWDVPEELNGTADTSMLALYHMDGGVADATPNGNNGTGHGITYTSYAKCGLRSAEFTGSAYFDVAGTILSNAAKTVEFWIKDGNLNDGIMELANDAKNNIYFSLEAGLVKAVGVPDETYTVYVNGAATSRRLRPGWNHVAIVSASPMPMSQLIVGRANGDYLNGALDEMAIYTRALDEGEIKGHYVAGRRPSAGRIRLQVRSGDELPLTSTFVGDDGTALDWFEVSQHAGAVMHGSIYNKRYFQYRVQLEGDGESTPTMSALRVTDVTGQLIFEDNSLDQMDEGDMDGGNVQWVGDEVKRQNLATVPGLVNLRSPSPGLAGLWHMDESEWLPGATVLDTAAGQDGTPQNGAMPSVFSKVGAACGSFDGVDDYVIIPGMNLGGNFTVSAWFKSSDTRRSAIVARSDGSFVVELNGNGTAQSVGKLAFTVNGGTAKSTVAGVNGLNDGVWHHFTGVRNGDFIYIYVDGVACGSAALGSGYGGLGVSDIWVGSHPSASKFKGTIDEVALYTRSLSDAEVQANLAIGVSTEGTASYVGRVLDAGQPAIWESIDWREGAPYGKALTAVGGDIVGLWQMDETGGSTITDSSGEGLDGTLSGGVTPTAAGRFGGAMAFSGGFVNIPDAVVLDAVQVSVEAWVKFSQVGASAIFDHRSGGSGYALGLDADSKPYFEVGGTVSTAQSGVQAGQWYHVAGTYDGAAVRIYVNGFPAGLMPGAGLSTDGGACRIGASLAGSAACAGTIDAVAVHAYALSGQEVMDHASAGFAQLRFQVRVSPDPSFAGAIYQGPDGTTNTYFTVPGESMVGKVPLGRYFQARARLSTENGWHAPILQGMTINQSAYPTHYPWGAPATGHGQSFIGKLLTFSHQMATNVDSSVRYQLSGDNGTNWYYWGGGEWDLVPVTSNRWLYASPIADINTHIGSVYQQLYPKVGGTFKYKSLLSSPGDLQVAVDWVQLSISEGALVVEQPNGDEVGEKAWVTGVPYDIKWSSSGRVSDNLNIDLYDQSGARLVKRLATGIPNNGSFTTIIGNDRGTTYRIRIRDVNDATVEDWSDRDFELTDNLRLTAPNGGEYWYATQTNRITWESPGPAIQHVGPQVQLWFSPDGGTNWGEPIATISTNQIGRNGYEWLTPSNQARLVSERAKIAVTSPTPDPPSARWVDYSDTIFTNAGIAITYPSTGDGVKMGNTISVRWTAAGAGHSGVSIDFFAGAFWTNVVPFAPCVAGTNSYLVALEAENPTQGAKLRITSLADPLVYGVSEPFTLADVNIVAPIGGTPAVRDRWQIGTSHTIKWTAGGAGDTVDVEYSTDPAHTNWMPIAMGYSNVNSTGGGIYTNATPPWLVTGPPSSNAVIRVKSVSQQDLFAVTLPFDISGVEVTVPNGGEQWQYAAANTIRWTHQGAGTAISISLAYENNPTTNDFVVLVPNTFIFAGSYQFLAEKLVRPSNFARFKITALSPPDAELLPMFDVSNDKFQIKGMKMVAPTNRAVYTMGTTVAGGLQWYSAGADDSSAEVTYTSDGTTYGSTLSVLLNSDDGPGPGVNNVQNFTVPRTLKPSTRARMRVAAGPYTAVSEEFTLRGIRFTRPTKGQMFDAGAKNQVVQWVVAGLSASAYASNDVSTTGMAGPYINAALPVNAFVSGSAMFWNIPADLDPTTNAVIRMKVLTPSNDTDIVMYSDPFVVRGLKIKTPTTGDVWAHGQTKTIRFLSAGMGVGARANLYYSPDGVKYDFTHPITINRTMVDGANDVSWPIEATSELTRMPSTNAHVMVTHAGYTNVSLAFTLQGIKVTSPVGSDIWAVSDGTNVIRWASVGATGTYNIQYTKWDDSGTTPLSTQPIASGVTGNSFVWTMPVDSVASNVTISVSDGNFTGISEMFEIVPQPSIRIISPGPGDFWKVGETKSIRWSKGGSMDNAFVLYYSTDPFAVTNELWRGAFDFADGVYSYDWEVPFQLGRTRLIVTNQTDALVSDTFEDFAIAARFDIEPFTSELYALETHGVVWVTRGDVESVDLYYTTDFDRAPDSWIKINTEGPYSENIGHNKPATPYPWTLPNVKTDTVWLRVQDHDYPTERFSAAVPGPYDDLGPLSIHYYNVVWWVFDAVTSNHLNHLSTSDTSGWSASDLTSPILHEYPYGTWSTVWYREYFSDQVVFNWTSDHNMTNVVFLQRSAVEPDYRVLANFTYDPKSTNFIVKSWIERGGAILDTPEECTVYIFNQAGDSIETLVSASAVNGVFSQTWDMSATEARLGVTFTEADVFFARVEIKFSGTIYSSGLTFTLRVAASAVTLDNLEANTAGLLDLARNTDSNVTDIVTGIGLLRGQLSAGVSNLSSQIETSRTNILDAVAENRALLTNAVIPGLIGMTNDVVSVLLPAITNMSAAVSNVNADSASTLARILTRPVQVVNGTTVSFMYKTRRSYVPAEVGVRVLASDSSQVYAGQMAELTPGLGIYGADVPVNWGVGTYTLVCEDPMASDRMTFEVVDAASLSQVPTMLAALSNKVNDIYLQMTNFSVVVDTVDGLKPMILALSNDLHEVEFNITNQLAGVEGLKEALENVDKLTNALYNIDFTTITNLSQMVQDLTNALRGTDWQDIRDLKADMVNVTNLLTTLEVDKLQKIAEQISGVSTSLSEIAGVTNLIWKLDQVTNTLFEVKWAEIEDIRAAIGQVSNTLYGFNAGSFSNQLADIWRNVISATNTLAGLTDLQEITGRLDDLTNAIQDIGGVTNLAPQIEALTDALKDVDWGDITKIQDGVSTITNSLAGLTDLPEAVDKLSSLTNIAERLDRLTNLVDVSWEDVRKIMNDIAALSNLVANSTGGDLSTFSNQLATAAAGILGISNTVISIQSQTTSLTYHVSQLRSEMDYVTNALSGVAQLGDIADQINTLTNVVPTLDTLAGTLDTVDLPAMSAGVKVLTNSLYGFDWNTVNGDATLSEEIYRMLDSRLGTVNDTVNSQTFFGRLAQITATINSVAGKTDLAASNAQKAKTQASAASTGIRELKSRMEAGTLTDAGMRASLEKIRSDLGKALGELDALPGELGVEAYGAQLASVAEEVRKMAESKGFKNLDKLLPEATGAVGEEGKESPEKKTVEELNTNMTQVKTSLSFMRKLMDEMRYEPVVQSSLVGGQ